MFAHTTTTIAAAAKQAGGPVDHTGAKLRVGDRVTRVALGTGSPAHVRHGVVVALHRTRAEVRWDGVAYGDGPTAVTALHRPDPLTIKRVRETTPQTAQPVITQMPDVARFTTPEAAALMAQPTNRMEHTVTETTPAPRVTVAQLAVQVAANTEAITQLASAYVQTGEVVTTLCQTVGVMQDDMASIRAMFAQRLAAQTAQPLPQPEAQVIPLVQPEAAKPKRARKPKAAAQVAVPQTALANDLAALKGTHLAQWMRSHGVAASGPAWVAARNGERDVLVLKALAAQG